MTSVPIWSDLPHITEDSSSTEMVRPYHGNHFLLDMIHQSPSNSAFDRQPITCPPSVVYSHKNGTRPLSSCSRIQVTTERDTSSHHDNCSTVGCLRPQSSNVFEMMVRQHEPSAISEQSQLLENKKFSELPINQIFNLKEHPTGSVQSVTQSLDSTNIKVIQQDETVSKRETNKSDWDISRLGEFYCPICDTNYWNAELFSSHLEGKAFSCRICTTDFTSHTDLKSHFLSHRGYRCGECKKYFLSKGDLSNHRKSSLNCSSTFECDICNKLFCSKKAVRRHKHDTHQSVTSMHVCVVCGCKFTQQFRLNSHQKSYHVAYENVQCPLCNMSLLGPEKLKKHKRLNHLRRQEPCSCANCGKVFYSKNSLIRHEKAHFDANEILCEFCGKSCKGRRALLDHIKYNHKDLGKIRCKTCNMEFQSMRCCRRHENSAHKPNIPVICEICGRTLKNKEQLKTHLQIHASDRQFKCDVCNATFKQAVALRTHSRIHSNICKYICSFCGMSFKWKQTFDKHKHKCTITQNS